MSSKLTRPHSNKNLAQKVTTQLKLKDVGKDSFIKLCEMGCDPEFLGEHLTFLISKLEYHIVPKQQEEKQRRPYKVSLRPLDSLELALGGLDQRGLKALQKKLIKLAKEVDKIKLTRLVRYLSEEELEAHEYLFSIPESLVSYANITIPFLLEKLKQTGERERPIYTKYLNEICNHIKDNTGRPHYKLICDILDELDPAKGWNEDTLKQWRGRHKSSPN